MSGSLGDDYPKQQARLREARAVAADLPIQSAWFYIAQIDSLLKRAAGDEMVFTELELLA